MRLISEDGKQLGIIPTTQALAKAEQANLDLAEIAPNAQPPVVKLLDWGKYRYEQTKQQQKSRKNQRQVEVKQIRLGLKIGEHDFLVKLKRARKFLDEGHKVKVSLLFRGREITHPDLGRAVLDKFMAGLEDVAAKEQDVQLSGRDLNMIVGVRKDAKTQNP